jgi:predicted nucleotidyltransferase/DNA-binding XRE family transcriptional regulator
MVDAGGLVRSARERAHLSARALARASHVSTSTVTRIERGEINPTVEMLDRLLAASGNRLVLEVEPAPGAPTLDALRRRRKAIVAAVEARGGSNVRVFGSVARGEATEHSDVDLLIDVAPGTGLFAVEQLTDELADLLPWKVDVVTSGAARDRMAHVLAEAVPL